MIQPPLGTWTFTVGSESLLCEGRGTSTNASFTLPPGASSYSNSRLAEFANMPTMRARVSLPRARCGVSDDPRQNRTDKLQRVEPLKLARADSARTPFLCARSAKMPEIEVYYTSGCVLHLLHQLARLGNGTTTTILCRIYCVVYAVYCVSDAVEAKGVEAPRSADWYC